MTNYIEQHGTSISFSATGQSWVILSDIEKRIKDKIENIGKPLKDWDINIYRGILTGCNEAFIIDKAKRDEIIAKDKKSAEIIRPILRGRDIARYQAIFADLYLINTHNGTPLKNIPPIDIKNYPAIKEHLDKYWSKIKDRDDQGGTPYNLRSCAYMDDFSKQKIVWARLMRISRNDADDFPRFSLIPKEYFVVDSLCFFTGNDLLYLQGILNSEFAMYYFFNNIAILDDGGMQMRQQYVELIPIPCVNIAKKQKISELVLILNKNKNSQIENELNEMVYSLYN
jgi:hypothetical protein